MNFFEFLLNELVGFFQVGTLVQAFKSGTLNADFFLENPLTYIGIIIPILTVAEFLVGIIKKNPQFMVYRINLFVYIINRMIFSVANLSIGFLIIKNLQPYALFQTENTWYWFLYGYLIWELGHYVFHYLSHKVRLLWCFHSAHHAPESMNLSVSYTHFFLEAPASELIRISCAVLLGLDPALLIMVMTVAPLWGSFIHVGENISKEGKFGVLDKLILTPIHHRIHHARNPLYIDTNYCNFFNIWDRLFGTYQEEVPGVKLEYGVTRKINSDSFIDVYFGECLLLLKDIKTAPTWKNRLMYIFSPPGWSHTGDHHTAKIMRKRAGVNQVSST